MFFVSPQNLNIFPDTLESITYLSTSLKINQCESQKYFGIPSKLQLHTLKYLINEYTRLTTGGPPLTQKSLRRFPLPHFLAYVRASGGFSQTIQNIT